MSWTCPSGPGWPSTRYETAVNSVSTGVRRKLNRPAVPSRHPMPPGDAPTAESFESEAAELLESIGRARKKVEGIAGVLDGTLDRYRERIDRLIRESEVDNWRQVRIFTRDVETIAADLALPLLLDAGQGGGIGVPAPPPGSDPDPLMRLLSNASPQVEAFRGRTFYGLLELPAYSDAKLTHIYGDSRLIRGALDEAWSWLKAIREDERRSLQIQWSEDAMMLRRRVPSVVAFLDRLGKMNDAADRGRELVGSLNDGRFESLQTAARLYATHGEAAERKWRGTLEKDMEGMRMEAARLSAVLKKFTDPAKVESG